MYRVRSFVRDLKHLMRMIMRLHHIHHIQLTYSVTNIIILTIIIRIITMTITRIHNIQTIKIMCHPNFHLSSMLKIRQAQTGQHILSRALMNQLLFQGHTVNHIQCMDTTTATSFSIINTTTTIILQFANHHQHTANAACQQQSSFTSSRTEFRSKLSYKCSKLWFGISKSSFDTASYSNTSYSIGTTTKLVFNE